MLAAAEDDEQDRDRPRDATDLLGACPAIDVADQDEDDAGDGDHGRISTGSGPSAGSPGPAPFDVVSRKIE